MLHRKKKKDRRTRDGSSTEREVKPVLGPSGPGSCKFPDEAEHVWARLIVTNKNAEQYQLHTYLLSVCRSKLRFDAILISKYSQSW